MGERLQLGAMDEDRYDRSKRIGWLDIIAVRKAKVLMIGAGALGNEVAKNLALSGFRRITIVDMDHVVGSNLNRCLFFTKKDVTGRVSKAEAIARGLKSLSDDVEPVVYVSKIEELGEGIFADNNIVLGCLDNIPARVHANSHTYSKGKPYIDGGMEGFLGKVMVVLPPDGACVQCGMNRSHAKVASFRFSCTGKGIVFHEPRLAAEITTTSVISAVMVRETLKILSGRQDMLLANSLYYDGQRNVAEEIEIPIDPDCPVHPKSRSATSRRK